MEKARLKKILKRTLYGCFVVLILAIFAPYIFTAGWHLTHKRTQQYANYQISVPNMFAMRITPDGVQMIRARTVISNTFYVFELIKMQQHAGNVNIEAWKDAAQRAMIQEGFKDVKSFNVCFEGFLESHSHPLNHRSIG